jgi:uncharacterized protein (DUF302 family)
MIQVNSTLRFEEVGAAINAAAHHHGASVLAVTDLGRLLHPDRRALAHDAQLYTICQTELYSVLLSADLRFAAFIPCRIAVLRQPSGVTLETQSVKKFCDTIHRPDLDRLAAPLEDMLRQIMEEAAGASRRVHPSVTTHTSSSPGAIETQMNMRAAIPQRIDCHGTKVEDLGGTGQLDAPGG